MSAPLISAVSLDHVGVATTGPSAPLATLIGSTVADGKQMPSGVVVGRFGPEKALEMVWSGGAGSPIDGFLARRGPGLHHIALRVEQSLEELLPRLTAAGIRVTGPVEPSSDGRPSLFLHPATTGGVLVELVEGASR